MDFFGGIVRCLSSLARGRDPPRNTPPVEVQRCHLYCSEAIRSTVVSRIASAPGIRNAEGQAVPLSDTKSSDRAVVTPYADAARGRGNLSLS